jgi:hypothetical protein
MKSWKKENKLIMKVTYSMDKYKESEDYANNLQTIEGEMIYVNMPMANSFLNIKTSDGEMLSSAYQLVMKIEWQHMPKWTHLSEQQVVDSASMRLKNLDNELEVQKQQFAQHAALEAAKDDNSSVGSV